MDHGFEGPKYVQIYQQLKNNIFSNYYEADGRFPAESELMEQFQVSRTTIRRAMDLLRKEGLIESRKGHGTDVMSNLRMDNSGQNNRLTNVQRVDFTFLPASVESTKHSETVVDTVPVFGAAADALQVESGVEVYRIRWLHFVNDSPYLFLTNFIRTDIAPDLPNHISGMVSLYPLLAKEYGLIFMQAVETVEPVVADFISSRLLEVPAGTPLLQLNRTAESNKGPMEYSCSLIRPDLMRISMILK